MSGACMSRFHRQAFRNALNRLMRELTEAQIRAMEFINENPNLGSYPIRSVRITREAADTLHAFDRILDRDFFWDLDFPFPTPNHVHMRSSSAGMVDFTQVQRRASDIGLCLSLRISYFCSQGFSRDAEEERQFRILMQTWSNLWALFVVLERNGGFPTMWFPREMFVFPRARQVPPPPQRPEEREDN